MYSTDKRRSYSRIEFLAHWLCLLIKKKFLCHTENRTAVVRFVASTQTHWATSVYENTPSESNSMRNNSLKFCSFHSMKSSEKIIYCTNTHGNCYKYRYLKFKFLQRIFIHSSTFIVKNQFSFETIKWEKIAYSFD